MAKDDFTVKIECGRIMFMTSYRDEFGEEIQVANIITKERLIKIRDNINRALKNNDIKSSEPHLPLADVSGRSEQVCPVCKGTGWVESKIHLDADERCSWCKGQTCH